MKWPLNISKAYVNSSSRRKDGKGKQTWRLYGYDEDLRFRTERLKGSLLFKPRIKLYHKKTGICIHCAKRVSIIVEKTSAPIVCMKCNLESP